jgi:hypothetical protein
MSDFCFVIGCHDKVEELLCHLEILTFYPEPYDVIVVYSGTSPLPNVDILKNVLVVPSENSPRPPLGAALAFWKGVFTVRRPPLPYIQHTFRYMCYRNCDDWIFNHEHVLETLDILKNHDKKLAGYNWFDVNKFTDLALNELYLKMIIVEGQRLEEWETYFKQKINRKCEMAVAEKLFELVKPEEFYRLVERESEYGIGNFDRTPNNTRYWHEKWLLLGHHDQIGKREMYKKMVRNRISYHDKLEQKENFKKWVR